MCNVDFLRLFFKQMNISELLEEANNCMRQKYVKQFKTMKFLNQRSEHNAFTVPIPHLFPLH